MKTVEELGTRGEIGDYRKQDILTTYYAKQEQDGYDYGHAQIEDVQLRYTHKYSV